MKISEALITNALHTALRAGEAIMEVYSGPFDVELKSDNSPLTIADKRAHAVISDGLAALGLPILSEEGFHADYENRKNWTQFWLIDPLDGTKEFIKRNGDFTVNIALINEQQPVFGVVYAPVPGIMFWGSENGSYRLNMNLFHSSFVSADYEQILNASEKLPCFEPGENYLVLGSRSHLNAETELFISELKNKHPELGFVSRGSSLKFCTLAEGGADIYPRFGPTMEWDTAAGHAVAKYAGCTVNQAENGIPLVYNKRSLLNPYFIAERKKNEVTY